ncbi:MAG: SCO family protein [Geminicoccaceae bacterium]
MRFAETARSRLLVYGLASLLLVVAIGGVAWYLMPSQGTEAGQGRVPIGGPFSLIDQHGKRVTNHDFAGRYMLIYFGYTYCPDICPLSLANMSQALDLMPPEEANRVVPIFITVDPKRDTVEQLADYAPLFHPRLVALTGTEQEIKDVARAYRVYFSIHEDKDGGEYTVDHSSFIYLMGPDGKYRTHFGHSSTPDQIVAGIRAQLVGR